MNSFKFYGVADKAAHFLQKEQLYSKDLWTKFVDLYRSQPDAENNGWRGEYWGKMMRGGALICAYTQDETLYRILTDTVKDMMTVMEEDGRVSTYEKAHEFTSWDIWCRKYVMLGCEYYLDICKDETLREEIVAFLCRQLDYIILHIGKEEGKISITSASRSWFGINSSSVLEPVVSLYRLTNEKRYLDFAAYIVENGGASNVNVFELAYENKLLPYQYGVAKAYELISCFEGLLEYYYATGIEKYKTAVINFAYGILGSECSVIGSCGITHELFDHTANRQTVAYDGVMQETCVTVTWMKFCERVLALTGDTAFADAMEISFYNAYLGSINTEHKTCPYIYEKYVERLGVDGIEDTYLPFDSYSPLTPGRRGEKVGGNQLLPDHSYYGCCACIGSAGVGVFLHRAICVEGREITVNFFENSECRFLVDETCVLLKIDTEYPVSGVVRIFVKSDHPVAFALKIREPAWAGNGGYRVYDREWCDDIITLDFPMTVKMHTPVVWDKDTVYTDTSRCTPYDHFADPVCVVHKPEDDRFVALTRGPLTLAADSRMGKAASSVFAFDGEGKLCEDRRICDSATALLKLRFTDPSGDDFYLIDYASAGKDWESVIAAWLPFDR